ncbi:alkaline phosphatase D family protein [Coralloluteibacterium stylophorae]|nr:alkaline phosphatase D family protein [Coralloluteibacterium stylophorae]MBS7457962.1 alkaline phosphatase D family protein [Coralloluteibacterium stylophorae]
MDRRRFLKTVALTAGAAAVTPAGRVLAAMAADAVRVSRRHFPQSVASGDPRPDRVLLWTRVEVAPLPRSVRVQVAEDAAFTALRVDREVAVSAEADGCIKVRIENLAPGRVYHYRFLIDDDGAFLASPHGRTRTAPAPDADVPVRLAFLSCQDYGGRWYNSLVPLLDEELDFVLHLGDFIYETTGDPQFQSESPERRIVFEDAAGAIDLGEPGAGFQAARSLSNYRQIHRSVRGDSVLQALLERTPLVAIWDDHEFSDDCWQDHGTYLDGRDDEGDAERRRNAEQAYFEYMPVDVEVGDDATLPVDRERLFPNVALYRSLRFGRALELVLTDYRSLRPDHLIPEDAFPGTVVYDRAALEARLPKLGLDYASLVPSLIPYVDLRGDARRALRTAARMAIAQGYRGAGLDEREAQARAEAATGGTIALPVLAQFLAAYNAGVPAAARVAPPDTAGLDRGLPWLALGKTQLFSAIGARYLVVKDSFDLFAALRALDGAPGAYGPAQHTWLAERLQGSDARFKIVASSVSFTSLVLDLARPELQAPEAMRRRFYLNVDHWDGFPQERERLLGELFDPAGGVILLSGDIHAGFATQHSAATVEFTTPAVSSETLKGILARSSAGEGAQADAGRRMVAALDELFRSGFAPLRYVQTERHGAGLLALEGDHAAARFLELPAGAVAERLYDDRPGLAAQVRTRRFAFTRDDMRLRALD